MNGMMMRFFRRGARLPSRAVIYAMREFELNRLLRQRRIDVSCCGLSKTGTHSMEGIFSNYRSNHHPDAAIRIPLAIATLQDGPKAANAVALLRARDRKLWLEMESSTLAGILIDSMLEACPGKKFILTLRDVYSWCDSWFDHSLNWPPDPNSRFAALDRVRLRADSFPPTRHDAPLTERGFPSLASHFQLWAFHNSRILDTVPAEKLLVVRTSEITDRMESIADWVGAEPSMLRRERAWLASAPKKHGLLDQLDVSYVQDTASEICGKLMEKFFPNASAERFSIESEEPDEHRPS